MFENLREDFKKALKEKGMTYAQLSDKTGAAESTIKRFMCGADNSRRVAESIADVLNYKLIYSNGVYEIAAGTTVEWLGDSIHQATADQTDTDGKEQTE